MAALATVADLSDWLGVTITGGTADGTRAQAILDNISAVARRTARQTFDLVADDSVSLRGTDGPILQLPERPVTAVTSVDVDQTALTSDEWELLAGGRLRRVRVVAGTRGDEFRGTWGGPLVNVDVTYTHGGVPDDVKAVVLGASARAWANPQGALYESVGSYRIGFANTPQVPTLTEFEVELLKSYRPRP